jgi:hypothetical protein
MKQNRFADLEDWLEKGGRESVASLCFIASVVYLWIDTGTFLGAIFLAILGSFFFTALPTFFVCIFVVTFARRDYGAPGD